MAKRKKMTNNSRQNTTPHQKWYKITLYREYHCPVTDKKLQYTEDTTVLLLTNKKSLKIPKGQSESVYRRRTDNTMAKRKSAKVTNNDQQDIHIKLKIE